MYKPDLQNSFIIIQCNNLYNDCKHDVDKILKNNTI